MTKRSNRRGSRSRKQARLWQRMDLHLHTPASSDYQEPHITYLDILRQAEIRGVDIIGITDHNTVAGFAALKRELEQLLWLEEMGRIEAAEQRRLEEYRRLLQKILVLPGFEFTATFGFHILGLFPPETPVSFLEHLLLTLNIPLSQLHTGSSTVGATTDVLSAYQIINEAGGLVIAAHANSGNGVIMRGLDFGGQTRIAYTQDPNLHVLEVTDLDKRGRYSTRRFFDGSKPEYPRPMRCIQGSDAHRLTRDGSNGKNLGVGDRITEISLEEVSFEALLAVLKGNDFALTRPYRGPAQAIDFVQFAREEGESIVQAFHTSLAQRGGHMDRVLRDICAMANTNGGTIYVGVSENPAEKPAGIREPQKSVERILAAVSNRFSPEPDIHVDTLPSQGTQILRITIQPGKELPYAIDTNKFYVRDEADTTIAVRDEIVRLVERALHGDAPDNTVETAPAPTHTPVQAPRPRTRKRSKLAPPRTGVEVVNSEKRQDTIYHTVRDLRNGNLIKNVTRSSARKLWRYAITQVESGHLKPDKLEWKDNIALIERREKGDHVWYDLALRDDENELHVYYGVTDSGLSEAWLPLLGEG